MIIAPGSSGMGEAEIDGEILGEGTAVVIFGFVLILCSACHTNQPVTDSKSAAVTGAKPGSGNLGHKERSAAIKRRRRFSAATLGRDVTYSRLSLGAT